MTVAVIISDMKEQTIKLTKLAPCQVTHGLKWTVSKLIFTGKVAFTQSRFPKITF